MKMKCACILDNDLQDRDSNVVALTRNLTIMTMCLSGVPLHMPAHESSGSHIIRAHGGVLAGR